MMPPDTMPTIAAATANVPAAGTPAASKSGANASPVAGPPVSVTDPASTPINGCCPRAIALTIPIRFCATAASVEIAKNTRTSGPPTRSSETLAPKPIDVKNAIISGVCSVVSSVTSVVPV
jgi:hypothetical protein